MNLKKKKHLLLMIVISSLSSQNLIAQMAISREQIVGVWEQDFGDKAFTVYTKNYAIDILPGETKEDFLVYKYAFVDNLTELDTIYLSDLKDKGNTLILYQDNDIDIIKLENGKKRVIGINYGVEMYEDYIPVSLELYFNSLLNYSTALLSKDLEKELAELLKSLGEQFPRTYIYSDWKKYASVDISKLTKISLYSKPNLKTNMYLISGDVMNILEEQERWLKIEYFGGKKRITGWVKREDVDIYTIPNR